MNTLHRVNDLFHRKHRKWRHCYNVWYRLDTLRRLGPNFAPNNKPTTLHTMLLGSASSVKYSHRDSNYTNMSFRLHSRMTSKTTMVIKAASAAVTMPITRDLLMHSPSATKWSTKTHRTDVTFAQIKVKTVMKSVPSNSNKTYNLTSLKTYHIFQNFTQTALIWVVGVSTNHELRKNRTGYGINAEKTTHKYTVSLYKRLKRTRCMLCGIARSNVVSHTTFAQNSFTENHRPIELQVTSSPSRTPDLRRAVTRFSCYCGKLIWLWLANDDVAMKSISLDDDIIWISYRLVLFSQLCRQPASNR